MPRPLSSAYHPRFGYTKIYDVWRQMLQRCENPDHKDYAHYGARGISVCKRWHDIQAFVEDMGEGRRGLTLDRVDVDGDYCPENCRWVSQKVQTRNARSNIELTFDDRTQCLGAWAEELNIKYGTLYSRVVTYGWPTEKALTTPVRQT